MTYYHACVWLDHREARVFGLAADDFDESDVRDDHSPAHIHRKADHIGQGKAGPATAYFAEIAEALRPYRAILIVGPGTARTEFATYLADHEPELRARVWDIKPMDHPTTPELLAAARKYFRAADRMHG